MTTSICQFVNMRNGATCDKFAHRSNGFMYCAKHNVQIKLRSTAQNKWPTPTNVRILPKSTQIPTPRSELGFISKFTLKPVYPAAAYLPRNTHKANVSKIPPRDVIEIGSDSDSDSDCGLRIATDSESELGTETELESDFERKMEYARNYERDHTRKYTRKPVTVSKVDYNIMDEPAIIASKRKHTRRPTGANKRRC